MPGIASAIHSRHLAGQKEPFDILYFTPSVAMIASLDDCSLSVTPDLVDTGIKNAELRARLKF